MKKLLIVAVMAITTLSASAQARKVQYKLDNIMGTMQKIRVKDDPTNMNWIIPADGTKYPWIADPRYSWGTFKNTIPQGTKKIVVGTAVRRYLTEGGYNLVEEYTVENNSEVEIDLSQIEICTPWNAKYLDVDTAKNIRCRLQVFTTTDGSTATCIKATRISGRAPHIGLMMLEGDISGWYSGDCNDLSDESTCGVMFVKLEKKMLKPGKKYTIKWQLFAYDNDDDFKKRIRMKYGKKTVLKGFM